eukprot:scaffold248125_cov30-Tisochrysis_lutea.AAC.1
MEIVVISSLSPDYCHIVTPPDMWKVPLTRRCYLGHFAEFHYVSTRPAGKTSTHFEKIKIQTSSGLALLATRRHRSSFSFRNTEYNTPRPRASCVKAGEAQNAPTAYAWAALP